MEVKSSRVAASKSQALANTKAFTMDRWQVVNTCGIMALEVISIKVRVGRVICRLKRWLKEAS